MFAIADVVRTTNITEVESVVVTTITADAELGGFVRDIRVFAKTTVDPDTAAEVVFTLRLRAPTADPLKIDVPAAEF